jgi:hypothetical protein
MIAKNSEAIKFWHVDIYPAKFWRFKFNRYKSQKNHIITKNNNISVLLWARANLKTVFNRNYYGNPQGRMTIS